MADEIERKVFCHDYELLRIGVVDSQGDLISARDFPDVNGQRVPVMIDFDPTRIVGIATLRREGDRIMAAVEYHEDIPFVSSAAAGKPQPHALAAGFEATFLASTRALKVSRITGAAIVRPEDKIR